MELGGVPHFLKGKTILVTGATGFLAKVFVEKLLRTQSDIKKLYLLLRASDSDAAQKRLHHEIIRKDLFRVLREKWGGDFDTLISEKVEAIAGDVSVVKLGLEDANLQTKLVQQIDIIVNLAASTNFDERMEIAMGVNTMGALHVLNFAKTCHQIQAFLHVSTAYVCGEAKDAEAIKEEAFEMGQTLNGTSKFDIDTEKKMMQQIIQQLQAQNVGENTISSIMKDYGIKRANMYGWPNTYVFTKAMGEMLMSHFKDKIPLIIIRPTMVSSTYKEPFPGWIEGYRTVDALIGGYGKGKVPCFVGNPQTILDVIPADMVINCMMAAMVKHSNESTNNYIYHVGSSSRNPFTIASLHDILYHYFTNNPWINEFNGKPVIISRCKLLTSMHSFRRYSMIRYLLPLKGLNLVNRVFCGWYQDVYNRSYRRLQMAMRVAELYRPYVFFNSVFDDTNTHKLRMMMMRKEDFGFDDGLEFNPNIIDWTEYMTKVHVPGLIKYVMKRSSS